MSIWWAIFVLLLAVSGTIMWFRPCLGAIVAFALIYGFNQVSSALFLLPAYKDGGNGFFYEDAYLWLILSIFWTAGAFGVVFIFRRMLGKR